MIILFDKYSLCPVSSLVVQAKLTLPITRTRCKLAVGNDKSCSSGKEGCFPFCVTLWNCEIYVVCIRLSLGVSGHVVKRTSYCMAPAAVWLIKLEIWLHADSNYNPLTYYLAVSISLMMNWMPFLASLRQNSVNIIWTVSLELHRQRARSTNVKATPWR